VGKYLLFTVTDRNITFSCTSSTCQLWEPYCELLPYDVDDDFIKKFNPKGVILSGGGQHNYTTLSAIIYVAADLPAVIYAHSSVIILLGCLLGMGHLAAH
jgi:GMP synthase-like glutamine amidotransferase